MVEKNSDADEAKTKARGPDMAQQYISTVSSTSWFCPVLNQPPFSIIPGVQNHLQRFCSCPPSCFLISCCSLETAMSQTFTNEILCHVPLRTRVSVLTALHCGKMSLRLPSSFCSALLYDCLLLGNNSNNMLRSVNG